MTVPAGGTADAGGVADGLEGLLEKERQQEVERPQRAGRSDQPAEQLAGICG